MFYNLFLLGVVSGGRGLLGNCGGMNNPTHYVRYIYFQGHLQDKCIEVWYMKEKKIYRFQCNHMIHSYFLNPTTQSLLPSPLKTQDYASPTNLYSHIHTQIKWFDISWMYIKYMCLSSDYSLTAFYIFLYMNSLKAQVLLFHFTQLYIQ